jgi:uncharacterized protein (TIGR02466 family)
MQIENWFTVPVYYTDITGEDFSLVQKEISDSLDIADDIETGYLKSTSYMDNKLYIEKYNLVNFKRLALFHIEKYIESLNLNSPNKITLDSWINLFFPNDYHPDHHHTVGSSITGVYYYKTNHNDGDLVLTHPNNTFLFKEFFPFTKDSKFVTYKPIVGRMILFPSWLIHRVQRNETNHIRVSLAFDARFEN